MTRFFQLLVLMAIASPGFTQEEPEKLPQGWMMRQVPGTNVVLPLSGELVKDKGTETSQKFKFAAAGLIVQIEVSQPDPRTPISKPVVDIMGQSLVASFQSAAGKKVDLVEAKDIEVSKSPAYRVVMAVTEKDVKSRLRLLIVADDTKLVMLTIQGSTPTVEADSARIVAGLRIVKPRVQD